MAVLLIVHHTPSPATQHLLEEALRGAAQEGLEDLDVVTSAALTTSPVQVLQADAILLGTPANIGYMSGALKHFFDSIYYPCLQQTPNLPVGWYVHGNDDTQGADRSIRRICRGLSWREVARPVEVLGAPDGADRQAVGDLAATLGAHAIGLLD